MRNRQCLYPLLPQLQTVSGSYRLWVKLEVWSKVNDVLVEQSRLDAKNNAQPRLGICGSASIKLGTKEARTLLWLANAWGWWWNYGRLPPHEIGVW